MFKPIVDFPKYEVSSSGVVRRFGKELKQQNHPQGYKLVTLRKQGKQHSRTVHRIVAKTFLGEPQDSLEVNHKNGIKTDNSVENLEWVTPKENIRHAYELGLRTRPNAQTRRKMSKSHTGKVLSWETRQKIGRHGEESTSARLTWDIVNQIRSIKGLSQKKIGEKFGICQQHVCDILSQRRWRINYQIN